MNPKEQMAMCKKCPAVKMAFGKRGQTEVVSDCHIQWSRRMNFDAGADSLAENIRKTRPDIQCEELEP